MFSRLASLFTAPSNSLSTADVALTHVLDHLLIHLPVPETYISDSDEEANANIRTDYGALNVSNCCVGEPG